MLFSLMSCVCLSVLSSSRLTTLEEVVDEIYGHVKHVELMVAGKDRLPSTACFLLYKLFTLDPPLNKKQLRGQAQTLFLSKQPHACN
jgi:hypothetical protein